MVVTTKVQRFTIWQCRDWCCAARPAGSKWWNVAKAPGNYASVPSWSEALLMTRRGKFPW